MKRKFPIFIAIVIAVAFGILIGYYIGTHSYAKNQDKSIILEAESSNLPIYSGPFGLNMGLSLNEVKHICKVKHIENDAYEIIPPKTNGLFETYVVWIDPDYGVYAMRAISEDINANDHGTELKLRFESIVESIENRYGKYKRIDALKGNIFKDPSYFMYTLREGSRELSAVWAKKYQSHLPDDIAGIAIEILAKNAYSNIGYVILEYGFSNSDAVKAKADMVF